MSFDQKLRELRLENEMTQAFVAKRLNVARSTIAGYETKNRQPSHEKLTALANLFHVTVDYLLDEDGSIELSSSQNPHLTVTHPDEQTLLLRYRNLSMKSRKDMMEYLHLLELRDQAP